MLSNMRICHQLCVFKIKYVHTWHTLHRNLCQMAKPSTYCALFNMICNDTLNEDLMMYNGNNYYVKLWK